MIFEPFRPFLPCAFQVKFATATWEKRGAARLRREVFCEEQGLFAGDDRDAIDEVATPIVAVSMLGVVPDDVVGTVRIHEEAPGTWWGSRLAVAQDYRKVGALGPALIRLAVSSAHARGCTRFLAHVQSQNGLLFRRLHWAVVEEKELHGRPHLMMEADLRFYPPIGDAETGFQAHARGTPARPPLPREAA
ncbi:MSMEG_0567/Sll0786 family nitrogen starvation N-acetyltransferase [Ancylobacter mangrovi]|uniref:MSMEG_0567/Sll0786 family nitrogen starvation N-acetyltransferase n=1 Tax=Ancylobacter mangrovi TaxID=2972472 RepID=UPI0021639D56|nr:MSMEG_0567/Sll0786 family nitrogen starvation N-acetyltransferase [Ancylobacter mangrovi]MCS0504795.1 GNAT family N-acetyltransferase [Ancylobacter mangrovi]